ncbi:hypothetical protein SFC08_04400 [Lysinibacillus halotolerans]
MATCEGTTDAALIIGNHKILFKMDDEATELFSRIHECKAVELLALLARKGAEY